jgi:uncharacterized protein YbaR (Trm112 family)
MNEALLEVLACPLTRTKLRWDAERQELVSDAAGLAFPVVEGIPVMLVEKARPVAPSDGQPPEQ